MAEQLERNDANVFRSWLRTQALTNGGGAVAFAAGELAGGELTVVNATCGVWWSRWRRFASVPEPARWM